MIPAVPPLLTQRVHSILTAHPYTLLLFFSSLLNPRAIERAAISFPVLTVGIRPGLLDQESGVPPGSSGGNFNEFSSSRGSSHAPTSLASSARLLSSVKAFADRSYYP